MDLRALALTALLVLGAGAHADEPPASELDALRDEAELGLDAETLADLDALLVDPVDLETGDLDRLRALPWLGEEELASLRDAPPPAESADLARLPGWNEGLARRVAPFVRFAARPASAPPRVAVSGSARSLAVRFESLHTAAAGRISDRTGETLRGHVRLRSGGAALAAGDLRFGVAQGLLAWTGETSLRAGTPVWRQARGLAGTTALGPARTVRGLGFERRGRSSRQAFLAGRDPESPIVLAAASARVARSWEIEAAMVRAQGTVAWSVGTTLGGPARRLAIEVAGAGHPAVAAAGEIRKGPVRCGTRLEIVPRAHASQLSGPTASARAQGSRGAALAVGCTARGVECDAGLVRELRAQSEGGARLRTEGAIGLGWRNASTRLEARLVWRATRADTWIGEAEPGVERDATRAWLFRVHRRPWPGWRATLELRTAAAMADSAPERDGRGWSVRVERERGALRPALAAGTFHTDPGVSLAGPAPAGGLGSLRLRGDGVHATLALRCALRGFAAAAGATARWTAVEPVRLDARWTVNLRLP